MVTMGPIPFSAAHSALRVGLYCPIKTDDLPTEPRGIEVSTRFYGKFEDAWDERDDVETNAKVRSLLITIIVSHDVLEQNKTFRGGQSGSILRKNRPCREFPNVLAFSHLKALSLALETRTQDVKRLGKGRNKAKPRQRDALAGTKKLKNKKKKIRMLNSLANYLLGGNNTGRQGSREGSNNQIPEACPVMARLRQVEVEGDDWILIDRAGEGALEESWYLTPPPCFTRAGPVNVETSPLEDLLIEHPSMSVYRATASPVAPETPPPTPDAPDERNVEENEMVLRDVLPDANMSTPIFPEPNLNPRRRQATEQEDVRRPSIHDGRPATDRSRRTEQRIQLRSAQKVMYVIGRILPFFLFCLCLAYVYLSYSGW
ncbi:hypothetical protein K0M31_008348 [Melipona bicolor]|uniref:Uncharacterized protein n=1 Tax=Melipona bicolor TaxID=60889 RepID=A0AA40FRF4_9HYME|nr:hypothetical protein K0M31_008348 [Melipona bicolor]